MSRDRAQVLRPVPGARLVHLLLGATWLALPFAAGPAFAAALEDVDAAPRLVASVLLWAAWAAVLPALLVPRPIGLTVVRVVAPCAPIAALLAALDDGAGPVAAGAALGTTLLAAALALSAETGWTFVNGAAYGDEVRHLLRAPGALLMGPIPLAWAVLVAGATAGPLLLADRRWVLGGLLTAAGLPAAAILARALDRLTRRWAVFVPAGMVLHDAMSLTDPVLFTRASVRRLGPAPSDSGALDLTQRAPGLALELSLHEAASMFVAVPRQPAQAVHARALLFTPSRPGAVLAEAGRRRLPVG
jgi:hypothetical protein